MTEEISFHSVSPACSIISFFALSLRSSHLAARECLGEGRGRSKNSLLTRQETEAAVTINCDRFGNMIPADGERRCTVSALYTSWLPSRPANPSFYPYARERERASMGSTSCYATPRHVATGFVARNDKSVLFDVRVPPLPRVKFIIMFCMYVPPSDALAATMRHFRKPTDAFPARPANNEDNSEDPTGGGEGPAVRPVRVCEVNTAAFALGQNRRLIVRNFALWRETARYL